jgi:hypothetical protein
MCQDFQHSSSGRKDLCLFPCRNSRAVDPNISNKNVSTYALSFYGSNSFWPCPNHFGQVQIIKISPKKSNSILAKIIWTLPKQFGCNQNNLYPSQTIWTVQNHFGPIEGQGNRAQRFPPEMNGLIPGKLKIKKWRKYFLFTSLSAQSS